MRACQRGDAPRAGGPHAQPVVVEVRDEHVAAAVDRDALRVVELRPQGGPVGVACATRTRTPVQPRAQLAPWPGSWVGGLLHEAPEDADVSALAQCSPAHATAML